jgi:hypothetical protein
MARLAAKMQPISLTAESVDMDLVAAATGADGGLKRFSMTAYTGAAMQVAYYQHPVVIDLAGMKIKAARKPILRDHNPAQIVGHTDAVRVTDGPTQSLQVTGVISGTGPAAREVVDLAANGFPWQASVGASVDRIEFVERGQSVNVNGRSFFGPLYVARATELGEVSFVPIGADNNTTANVAAIQHKTGVNMEFEKYLQAAGFDPDQLTDTQRAYLHAAFQAGNAKTSAPVATPAASTSLDETFARLKAEKEREDRVAKTCAAAIQAGANIEEIERLGRAAVENNWDVNRVELEALRLTRPAASRFSGGVIPRSSRATSPKVIEAAVLAAAKYEHLERDYSPEVLEAANDQWRHGLGLGELILTFARKNGYQGLTLSGGLASALRSAFEPRDMDIRASIDGTSSYSISGILSNVANKFLRVGFESVEQSWRPITAIRAVRDFKQISSYTLTGAMVYEKVAPGGEIKHGSVSEETYTNKADTYGRMIGIDRRDLINDDLGALSSAGRRLGRGGALKLNDVFWTEFLDNSSFFSSGNSNYISGATTLLSSEGLRAGLEKFRKLTDPDGMPMGHTPRYLVVPPEVEVIAMELYTSTNYNTGGAATTEKVPNRNIFAGKYLPVVSNYLSNSSYTGYSTTAWYLVADPQDVPVIETVFLNGVESPTVESAEAEMNQLGIYLRGYHDFGVKKQEKRGGIKSKGAA